jgi:hypothetical protein
MQCGNNLKQISLGTHNYMDSYKAFPAGEYACCWGTWLVGLLPYVEQKPLFDQYQFYGSVQNQAGNNNGQTDATTRYGGSRNLPVTRTQVPTYTCPSDSISASPGIINGVTFHNYVGNHGNTGLLKDATMGLTTTGQPNTYGGAPIIHVGAWNANPQSVKGQDVIDGLSNTLLFSETVQGKSSDLRGFAWWNGGSHFETFLPPNSRDGDRVEQNCILTNPLNPPCVMFTTAQPRSHAARSRHPGGVQASLCDGSVRFISNSIHLDTWRWVSTIYGKESFGEF